MRSKLESYIPFVDQDFYNTIVVLFVNSKMGQNIRKQVEIKICKSVADQDIARVLLIKILRECC